ncbi:MAG: hypothetical protein OXS35_07890, partial [Dehalococcoidia bacterium]|nr:hypothetical protein [Dehalococcoidia bacterium]
EPVHITSLPTYMAEEFPDVAALGPPYRWQWIPRATDTRRVAPTRLDRIYKRSDGEVVRETLVTTDELAAAYPDAFSEIVGHEQIIFRSLMVTPDGSHVHIGVCQVQPLTVDLCHGIHRLFRSTDGGVTWSYLGTVDSAEIAGVVPGEEPQLAVLKGVPQGEVWQSVLRLFPSGETRIIDYHRLGLSERRFPPTHPDAIYRADWQLLRDGRIAVYVFRYSSPPADMWDRDSREYFWLAEDGEHLGSELPDHLKVVLPGTSPIPSDLLQHYLPGDDPPDDWPDKYRGSFYNLESIDPAVIVQRGPFLRVTGVGNRCLPIRAMASADGEELACLAERVLLQDQGDTATDEGVTWRRSRRLPASRAGRTANSWSRPWLGSEYHTDV